MCSSDLNCIFFFFLCLLSRSDLSDTSIFRLPSFLPPLPPVFSLHIRSSPSSQVEDEFVPLPTRVAPQAGTGCVGGLEGKNGSLFSFLTDSNYSEKRSLPDDEAGNKQTNKKKS